MAEKIVSPGVFTNEKDLSFLPAGIAAIGAAIIGPTTKGPAFVPTVVTSFNDFIAKFGGLSEETYVPYAVKNYLKSASTVTVVRVLSEGGYATGVVNVLLAYPVSSSATYTLTTAIAADTGSSAANIPTTAASALANYTKLSVATGSTDLFDTTALQALTFYSASTLLTVTGSVFISASKYTALFKSQSLTLPSSSTTTYSATFTTYPLSTSTTKLIGTIAPTKTIGYSTNVNYTSSTFPTAAYYTTTFPATLAGNSVTAQSFSGSVLSTSNNNLKTVLGTSVGGSKYGYLYNWYQNAVTGGVVTFESSSLGLNLSGSYGAYAKAATPWITSQLVSGQTTPNLFKVRTIADGTNTNRFVKISIINTLLPGQDAGSDYGTFTLLVRDYNDTDQKPIVLETFAGLNLDPDSTNYIARRIGDKYNVVSSSGLLATYGNYDNVSAYIWIEVDSAVSQKAIAPTLKPFGMAGYVRPISSSYATPAVAYVTQDTTINGVYNKKAYYGFNFAETDNENYLAPTPAGAGTDSTAFNLSNCYIHPSASKINTSSTFVGGQLISDGASTVFKGLDVSTFLKFTVALQGGFDGLDPAIPKNVGSSITSGNLFGLDCNGASGIGTVGYTKALNVISNADEYDVNLLVTPGATIKDHSAIVSKAIEVAEDRGDCFVIADPVIQGTSVAQAIAAVVDSGIDSNYVGTYWPWVKILDTDKNKPVWVPPSVVVPKVMAYNDSVAYEWFAPAGLNRGGIPEAVDIELKLSQADRNNLYENRINAIATFPNQGVCIWGQKTLQAKPSALDRISVRRLMIALKKYIASASRYLVFENNTTATRQRFLNIVNPYLETVKARQGLYAFKVVMDETNNTPDVIDRNIMYGQIYLQPAKAAEFIVLDFNILPTGASFENA